MLKLYDYLEAVLEEGNSRKWFFESRLDFFVNDIMEILNIDNVEEINSSLNRIFQACSTLNIPYNKNFKRVYRFDGEGLITDWKISPLACYMVIINCNQSYEYVAKAQLYFAMTKLTNRENY